MHVRLAGREESIYGYMPAAALFRVAARPSLDTGGGSIYVNLLSGLSSASLVCHTRRMNLLSINHYRGYAEAVR
jgi:hypothetical protein